MTLPKTSNEHQGVPLVSICMITYNHAEFIEQAIESVLSQRTDFPYELVIGEDKSTDDTAARIRVLAQAHPAKIRVRFNDPNLGMMPNFLRTFAECHGEYVAMLEGDDYWTDQYKLQKQVDFLEEHRDFSLCFHPIRVLEDGNLADADRFTRPVPEVTTITDLATGNYIHTCAAMYRADCLKNLPEALLSSPVGDYFLHMLAARKGPIGKLADTMAVYRVHGGGIWSAHRGIEEKVLTYLECMIGHFDAEIDEILKERHRVVSSRNFLQNFNATDAESRFLRCLRFGHGHILPELQRALADNSKIRTGSLNRVKRWIFNSLKLSN